MRLIENLKVEDVLNALNDGDTVLFYSDKTMFILNPFGGGSCSTQELMLSDKFKINNDNVKRMVIVKQ